MQLRFIQIAFIYSLIVSSIYSFAADTHGLSQKRDPQTSYTFYTNRKILTQQNGLPDALANPESVHGSARPIDDVDFQNVQAWESLNELRLGFESIRDVRFLDDNKNENFKRRSSWLFPDDGCFARAELANLNLTNWQYKSPNKIFAFGDLVTKTSNSRSGNVSWWYHVAPIVRVGHEVYVLDPAIEPKRPLEVHEWLARMGADFTNPVEVAICSSHSYDPVSNCAQGANRSADAYDDQYHFLSEEWTRQIDLQRDPAQVLGDNPPWRVEDIMSGLIL